MKASDPDQTGKDPGPLPQTAKNFRDEQTAAGLGDAIATGSAADGPARWAFGGPVAVRFDEHVRRQVPLYAEGHQLILQISDFFLPGAASAGVTETVAPAASPEQSHTEQSPAAARASARVYDIGCATGALLKQLASRHPDPGLRLIGIDREADMVRAAQARCADDPRIEILHADAGDVELKPADLIVSYYTMQFVAPRRRQDVFDQIYRSLQWGGALILFEKVRGPDARFQDIATQLYTEFKLAQGYHSDEILNKSRALKGVLEPFSTQGNLDLLTRAGFVDIMTVMKYICFEGFLAIK